MLTSKECYKRLPAIDKLLGHETLSQLVQSVGHAGVKGEAGFYLQQLRADIAAANEETLAWISADSFLDELIAQIEHSVRQKFSSSLKPVFNLTGTVIHTNLGRANLPLEALAAMELAATECTNLEFDLVSGSRGDRDSHIEASICDITGAEAATVVNNNAAAVLLVLNTFAKNKDVLISRGELVEIGGSFRIPAVMESAGCRLKEVGTTNRTHLADFETVLDENSALIMRVHTSNYEIQGFTQVVPEKELAELAVRHNIPFISDLGSGTLVNLTRFGLPDEPTVAGELERGADVVTFSGDKLLGGPQAGIIVGSAELIARIKKNPLKRALRIDKITMAGLLEVINLYRDPDRLKMRLPVMRDLTRSVAEIDALAQRLLPKIEHVFGSKAKVSVQNCKSQIGSGSLPTELLESRAISIEPIAEKGERDATLVSLAKSLRELQKPVIGRVHAGSLLLDLRCLQDEEALILQLEKLQLE